MVQLDPVNSSATFSTPYIHQLESSKHCKTHVLINSEKGMIHAQKQPNCKNKQNRPYKIQGSSQEIAVIPG